MAAWRNGIASDYESGDCRFDPCGGQEIIFGVLFATAKQLGETGNLVLLPISFLTVMSKRGASPPPQGVLIKRARSSSPVQNQIAISSSNDERQQALIRTVKRTSSLEAPIISLSGAHGVRVIQCLFVLLLTLSLGRDFEL